MNIWLISDTHFYHDRMYQFVDEAGVRVRSQFKDATEGDAYMIEAWNSVVKPEDHVWHLGDVTMLRGTGNVWLLNQMIGQLNGHKRLVLGNHDNFDVRQYRDAGFQKVVGSHRHAGLLYSHIPLHPTSIENPRILANVHGHIHSLAAPPGKYVNVSVEQIGYTPIHLDAVLKLARQRLGGGTC